MIAEPQIDELQQAYDLLDCPPSASPRQIKQSYRRMTKRWHPDRYQSGTAEHAEATQMMKRINEAYAQIANAPLRNEVEGGTASWRRVVSYPPTQPSADPNHPRDPYVDKYKDVTPEFGRRIDFWTRFLVGALLGLAIAFRAVLYSVRWSLRWPTLVAAVASVIIVLVCALVSARTANESGRYFNKWWW